MYAYYVRNMYLENNLRTPGKLTMCGVPVDLRKIDMPAYVLATREDHIVPWKTAYASTQLLRGKQSSCWPRADISPASSIRPRATDATTGSTVHSLTIPDDWLAGATSQSGQLVDALERLACRTRRRPRAGAHDARQCGLP